MIATTTGLATVWTMTALMISLLIIFVYFCIFFMVLVAVFGTLAFFFRPLIRIIKNGRLD